MNRPRVFSRGLDHYRINFMKKMEEIYRDNERISIKFRRMLNEFSAGKIDLYDASLRMACLFKQNSNLQQSFTIFLPPGYIIGIGLREHVYLLLPITIVPVQGATNTQVYHVCGKQYYVTLIPPNHAPYLTGVRGVNHLKCPRHPPAIFNNDMMCTICFIKRYLRRNFEDLQKFICYVKSEADDPEMFDTFLRNLKELHSGKVSIQQLFRKMARLLLKQPDLLYEFYSFVINRAGILLDEKVKDYVDSLIPVPIDPVEVVIGSDSVPSEEPQVLVHALNDTADEPRRSARLQNTSDELSKDQEEIKPEAATKTAPIDENFQHRLQNMSNELTKGKQITPKEATKIAPTDGTFQHGLQNMSNELSKGKQITPKAATKSAPTNGTLPHTFVGPQNRRSVRLRQNVKHLPYQKREKSGVNFPSNCTQQQSGNSKTKKVIDPSKKKKNSIDERLLEIRYILATAPPQNSPQRECENSTGNNLVTQPQSNAKLPLSKKQQQNSLTENLQSTKPLSARLRSSPIQQSRPIGNRRPVKQSSSSNSRSPDKQNSTSTRCLDNQEASSTRSLSSDQFSFTRSLSSDQSSSTINRGFANKQYCITRGRHTVHNQPNSSRDRRNTNQQSGSARNLHRGVGQSNFKFRRFVNQLLRWSRFFRSQSQESTSSTLRSATPETKSSRFRRSLSLEPTSSKRLHSVSPEPKSVKKFRHSNCLEPISSSRLRSVCLEPISSSRLRSVSHEPRNSKPNRLFNSHEPANSTRHRSVIPEPINSKRFRRAISLEPTSSTRHRSVRPKRFRRSISLEPTSSTSHPHDFVSYESFTSTRHERSEKQ